MLSNMTSRYHDSGILALGFSAAAVVNSVVGSLAAPGSPLLHDSLARIACGALIGPLIVICLLLKPTVPHRVFLVLGLIALILYVVLGLR